MIKELEKEKNIMIMAKYYLKENIQMEKKLEKEENIMIMVN